MFYPNLGNNNIQDIQRRHLPNVSKLLTSGDPNLTS